jgi:hypothetical protein
VQVSDDHAGRRRRHGDEGQLVRDDDECEREMRLRSSLEMQYELSQ